MPQLRYFQTEGQRAQLADILATQGKKTGQPPINSREWVFDRLTEAAVQGSLGVNSVRDEGRVTLANGQHQPLTQAELEAEIKDMYSDPKWVPDREGAAVKIIAVADNSKLYNALIQCAALENAVTKKITGRVKYTCLEAYIDNVLNSHLRTDSAQMLMKDLQEEKRAVFAEKEEGKQEKKKLPSTMGLTAGKGQC